MIRYSLPSRYVDGAIARGAIAEDAVIERGPVRSTVRLSPPEYRAVIVDASVRSESPHVFIRRMADDVLERLLDDE